MESNLLTCYSAEILYVPMQGVDPFSSAAIDKYGASLQKAESRGIKVRALWLCNPHNPLGAFASITSLANLVDKAQVNAILQAY